MNAPAQRIAVLVVPLVSLLLVGPTTAPASPRGKADTVQRQALGGARVVKPRNWRRARALRQRRQAARAKAARTAAKTAATPTLKPGVLFNGDFEAGFSGWHVQSLADRASLVGDALQGSQAARFEVQPGDVEPETGSQRSEVSGPTFDQGDDLYIRDAIRVPAGDTFSGSWQIIQQLHEENWNSSPGLAVFLDEERALTLGAGDGSIVFWESAPLQSNRWYDLVYRVDLSQNPSSGFVEVWLDGVQQTLAGGEKRAYGRTIQAAQTYLKAGIYRTGSSSGTSVVEHDAIVVGDSYAAVAGS